MHLYLKSGTTPCAAQIMVALAEHRYDGCPGELYCMEPERQPTRERSAALYAMASTGDPRAGQILMQAAEDASWQWDPAGAVQSLLVYAKIHRSCRQCQGDGKDHRPDHLAQHALRIRRLSVLPQ
ncbi:MAG: hypothetical protein MZV63_27935 [Marinilabiliales bacterium]|nr:hypothetical protein [Marinilabiliales bacterium]